MGTPRVALRFRDLNVPEGDTIRLHRQILASQKAVYWGWWRKKSEPSHERLLKRLTNEVPLEVVLVDVARAKQFLASVVEIRKRVSPKKINLIPAYYRASRPGIPWWLVLDAIREVPFDSKLAAAFGDRTLVPLVGGSPAVQPPARVHAPAISGASDVSPIILHLSDLHIGDDHGFALPGKSGGISLTKTLPEVIAADVDRCKLSTIGAIVITGDLTTRAQWTKYRKYVSQTLQDLCSVLQVPKDRLLIIPGNHDFSRYSNEADLNEIIAGVNFEHEYAYRIFLNQFFGFSTDDVISRAVHLPCRDFVVSVGLLNSCRITSTKFTEYGFVGTDLDDVLSNLNAGFQDRPRVKVLALHHHLLPLAQLEEPNNTGSVSLALDAAHIMSVAQRDGVCLALHGHQHIPAISKYARAFVESDSWTGINGSDLFVLSAGSAGVSQQRLPEGARNTYTILHFTPSALQVKIRQIQPNGDELPSHFSGSLPIRID
jgi:hypothetical protein